MKKVKVSFSNRTFRVSKLWRNIGHQARSLKCFLKWRLKPLLSQWFWRRSRTVTVGAKTTAKVFPPQIRRIPLRWQPNSSNSNPKLCSEISSPRPGHLEVLWWQRRAGQAGINAGPPRGRTRAGREWGAVSYTSNKHTSTHGKPGKPAPVTRFLLGSVLFLEYSADLPSPPGHSASTFFSPTQVRQPIPRLTQPPITFPPTPRS